MDVGLPDPPARLPQDILRWRMTPLVSGVGLRVSGVWGIISARLPQDIFSVPYVRSGASSSSLLLSSLELSDTTIYEP